MTSAVRFAIFALLLGSTVASAQIIIPRNSPLRQRERAVDNRVYSRLAETCGAKFTGDEAASAQRMVDRDDSEPTVDVSALLRNMNQLRNCASVQRSGRVYICKKGTQFEYYTHSGRKLNSQPCDEVFVAGDQASCMKITGTGRQRTIQEIQTHRISSEGAQATCTSGATLQRPTDRPGASAN